MKTLLVNSLRLPICTKEDRRSDAEESRNAENGFLESSALDTRRYHPELFHLRKVQWAVFGTLTWRYEDRRQDTEQAQKNRTQDFKQLLKLLRCKLRFRGKQIKFYHATEFGTSGQGHLHFLLAKHGLEAFSDQGIASLLKFIWELEIVLEGKVRVGAGGAEILPYDQAKEGRGVAYCLKREFDDQGQERERLDVFSRNLKNWLIENPEALAQPKSSFVLPVEEPNPEEETL